MRDQLILSRIKGSFDPKDFSGPDEAAFRLLSAIAVQFADKYQEMPSRDIFEAEVERRLAEDPSYGDENTTSEIANLIEVAFNYDMDQLPRRYSLDLIQRFLDERRVGSHIGTLQGMPVPELVSTINQRFLSSRVQTAPRVDILAPGKEIFGEVDQMSSGVRWLNEMLGGGFIPGNLYGLIGPSGGGKTMLSQFLACEMARERRHVFYFSYEQGLEGDLASRIYSCITHTDVRSIFGRQLEDVAAENPKWYELFQCMQESVGPYLHMFDMTKKAEGGADGMNEIDGILFKEAHEGRKPDIVIIDWLMPMIQPYMAKHNIKQELRHVAQTMMTEELDIAQKWKCVFWNVHQLAPAECKGPKVVPDLYASAEFKSICWLFWGHFALGTKGNNNVCWFASSKARGAKAATKKVLINWQLSRVDDVSSKFVLNDRGAFVKQSGDKEEDDDTFIPGEELAEAEAVTDVGQD